MFMSLAIDAMHYKHWTACIRLWIPCEKLSKIQFTSAGTQEKFNPKENQTSNHKVDKSAPFKYAGATHWLKQSLLHSGCAVSNWCNAQQALKCMHSAVNTIQPKPGLRSLQRTMTDFHNLKRSDNPKKNPKTHSSKPQDETTNKTRFGKLSLLRTREQNRRERYEKKKNRLQNTPASSWWRSHPYWSKAP